MCTYFGEIVLVIAVTILEIPKIKPIVNVNHVKMLTVELGLR